MAEKLTILDIARLAGVSTATVSRVLNQKPDVDPATRERVLRIVEEQSFVPSIAAAGLRKRSRLLGALVPSLTWPLIPELMRGVGEVVGLTSYELILYSITDVNHEKDRSDVIDRIVGTRLAAGLLAVFPGPSAKHLAELHSREFPVVLIDDQGIPPEGTLAAAASSWPLPSPICSAWGIAVSLISRGRSSTRSRTTATRATAMR